MNGDTTRTTWHPQIQIDGNWCYINDESTLSRLVETDSASKATLLAIRFLHGFEVSV